jgi:hypothetical protein
MALEAVQAQAGHASIESARICLHLADDWLASQYRRAAEAIDAQVFADHPAARSARLAARRRCPPGICWPPRIPEITTPMRRYLEQIGCVLRPRSVLNVGMALRYFAGFLAQNAPEVTGLPQVTRRHIEAFKPWLCALPGQNKPAVTTATIAHRLGTELLG